MEQQRRKDRNYVRSVATQRTSHLVNRLLISFFTSSNNDDERATNITINQLIIQMGC
jgi:hypothetical protein